MSNFLKESGLSDRKTVGFEAGLEGAYFFNKTGELVQTKYQYIPVNALHLKTEDPDLETLDVKN